MYCQAALLSGFKCKNICGVLINVDSILLLPNHTCCSVVS
jgi:hypothetical protein